MSDHPFDVPDSPSSEAHDAHAHALPGWATALLQAPVASRPGARRAIMDAVRREGTPMRRRLASPSMRRGSRWPRRGLLTAFGAATNITVLAALFAVFVSVRSVRATRAGEPVVETSAFLLGDSVVARNGGTLRDSALRDTLRLVEFVLRGADVASAAVVGDFNGWRAGATTLQQGSDGAWRARVLVPRDVVRFAYQVIPARSHAPVVRARIDSI